MNASRSRVLRWTIRTLIVGAASLAFTIPVVAQRESVEPGLNPESPSPPPSRSRDNIPVESKGFVEWFTDRAPIWRDLAAVGLSIGVLSLAWEVYFLRGDLERDNKALRSFSGNCNTRIKAIQEELSRQQGFLVSSNESTKGEIKALNSRFFELSSEVRKLEAQINAYRSTMTGGPGSSLGSPQAETSRTSAAASVSGHGSNAAERELRSQPVGDGISLPGEQAEKTTKGPGEGQVVAEKYQLAYDRNDRSALKRVTTAELNITTSSEDALVRGVSSEPTELQVVAGGGSYLLVQRDQKNWLVPTFQTLTGFTSNQPSKGIFAYEAQPVSAAELRCAAEVEEKAGVWTVVNLGLVAVPSG